MEEKKSGKVKQLIDSLLSQAKQDETKATIEQLIKEFASDKTPILPPGVEKEIQWAQAGYSLGLIFGDFGDALTRKPTGSCYQESPKEPDPLPIFEPELDG